MQKHTKPIYYPARVTIEHAYHFAIKPIRDRDIKEKPINQNYLPLLIEDPPELPELQ